MKKQLFRLCCLILVIVMTVNLLPLTVFAEEYQSSKIAPQDASTRIEQLEQPNAQIVEENIANRTEFSKEFLLDNGVSLAVLYDSAVHYEKDGKWEEIDNTLQVKSDSTFSNKAGIWDISFPQQLSSNNQISVTKDGYTLSFSMAGELRQRGNWEVMSTGEEASITEINAPEKEAIAEPSIEATIPEEIAPAETTPDDPVSKESISQEAEVNGVVPVESSLEVTTSKKAVTVENEQEVILQESTVEEAEPVETIPPETIPKVTVQDETIPEEAVSEITELPKLEENGPTASVVINGVAQTFAVNTMNTACGQIQTIDRTEVLKEVDREETVLEKPVSKLLYADVYVNTDIQYDLVGNQVKESIIMDSYDDALRGYQFKLNTGKLVPVLTADGHIDLYDETKENIIMVMPAPYLVDNTLAYCSNVQVNLSGRDGIYMLTYLLPRQWLAAEERAWPVILDPVIEADINVNNIQDKTVSEGYNVGYQYQYNQVGVGLTYGKYRSYIQYANIPTLTSSDVIVKAVINMKKYDSANSTGTVEVHKVNSTWSSTSMTWNTAPTFNPNVEDYVQLGSGTDYSWDVTDIVRGWYSGNNTGMMFKVPDATETQTSTASYIRFYSSDYYADYRPSLEIYFRNNNGLESYWDYASSSAGRAGTGHINQYTGNLVWVHDDLGFGGNRMPVSINHVYNLNDAANNDFSTGYGWRTNFNQQIYQWSEDSNYYIWEDSDGTKHYFYNSASSTYKDEDGLELTLTTNGSGTQKYSITDKNGNVTYFDTNGRLTSIQNNQATKSSITITYESSSSKKIAQIADGVGRHYVFSYDSNGMLSAIEYYGSGWDTVFAVTTFKYTNGNLTAIHDTDEKISNYTYTGHILQTVSDIDGYKLQYTYYTPAATYQPYRVKKVAEFDGTAAGGELNFAYAHNQTTVTDHNGNSEILQFNNFGNTVSIQDGQGRARYAKYFQNEENDTEGKANQLKMSSKLQHTVVNLLADSSFENGTVWTPTGSYTTPNSVTTAASYIGSKSMLLSVNASAYGPIFTIDPGETYTFSAYVKTSGKSAWLTIGNKTSEVIPADSDWTWLEASYTNPYSVTVSITTQVDTSGTGSAYVDCVQLEKAPTASRHNLIQNGDFRNGFTDWSGNGYSHATASTAAAPQMETCAAKVTGNPDITQRLSQTVPTGGAAGDTFVFSGWAKGDSASLTGEAHDAGTRQFGIIAVFNYTDGTTREFVAQFNPDVASTANWQYASEVMVAEKPYSSITVSLAYDYNCNDVYFDGIQLFKETFGNSYTYDANGNVTSVVDLQNKTTTYEYTNNNLTAEVLPTGARLEYVYDNYHNVTQATTDTGVVYQFSYDTYGNNTGVAIAGNPTMSASAAYSTDGNRLVSTTDAAGQTTSYGYNVNTNVLEWVKYPKDTDATRTNYTYDNMYRMATATAATDTGLGLSAAYVYDTDDTLKSITTPSTTYNFTYGNFALRSGVKAGSRTLAGYTYTSQNNYLSTLAYGNNDSVQYTYDTQGRVTKQTYEDGSTVSYVYDTSGALATVTDSQSGITTTYYYDFLDRMMKYVEAGSGYSHSVGYQYDQLNNLTALVQTINGTKHTTSYTYDDDNRVTTVNADGKSATYVYDTYGRVSQQVTSNGYNTVQTEYYTYRSPSASTTSGQISSHRISARGYDVTDRYTYDANGNIQTISGGLHTASYVYDSANQLIRENNLVKDRTYTWTYDNSGNILTRTEYAYTTGALGTALDTVTYTYADTQGWGDLLIAYDGQSITYDTIGNPLSDGTRTYTWRHGRQLATLTSGGSTWNYTYNADGLRTKRTNGSTVYSYIYNGDKLSQMTVGSDTLYFTYDAGGTPLTVTYNGVTYYYITNIQGDVIGMLDSMGYQMVGYSYDAWGNLLEIVGSMADTLGTRNPLRYRGYVYDQEYGFYYLQSRYYNPTTGRFLNADAFASTGQGFLGNNMHAYCTNNPVVYLDPDGLCREVGALLTKIDCGSITCVTSAVFRSYANSIDYADSYGAYVGTSLATAILDL